MKDGANINSWDLVRRTPGVREVVASDIEGDGFALPFPSLMDSAPVPWFTETGDIALAMIARVRTDAELKSLRRSTQDLEDIARLRDTEE